MKQPPTARSSTEKQASLLDRADFVPLAVDQQRRFVEVRPRIKAEAQDSSANPIRTITPSTSIAPPTGFLSELRID